MKELSLFTGLGGGVYGSMILGWQTVAYVEKDKYCQKVIAQRVQDGWFDNGEIYGDISEFNRTDAAKYTGKIDILTGGFPCQPHSICGKREGTSDQRYLGDEIEKTISIIRPAKVLFENVRGILTDPAIIILCEMLKRLGYELSEPLLLGSHDCGGIHERKRVWIYATDPAQQPGNVCKFKPPKRKKQPTSKFRDSHKQYFARADELLRSSTNPKPIIFGVDDELPDWREQIKAIGNGQDPIVMATAYQLLSGERI